MIQAGGFSKSVASTRCLYAGLAQQEPTDPTGIMNRLRRRAAESDKMVYLGQYDNHHNWKAHAAWTGPQILKQLPEINVFCTTVGTGGELLDRLVFHGRILQVKQIN
jgi:cysteine synthase